MCGAVLARTQNVPLIFAPMTTISFSNAWTRRQRFTISENLTRLIKRF
jgi:hypothetical protein